MPVEFWRHGAWPVSVARSAQYAAALECAGWDGLAVGEGQAIFPDPYICLALAASSTTRIKLGTGVLVPIRHPLQAASSMASIHALADGRTHFSLGRGDGAMHFIGRGPLPVDEFRVYVERVQGYLRKQDVLLDGFASSIRPLFDLDPTHDIGKPRLDISATGPRTIALAAELGDSVTFAVGGDADRIAGCIAQARSVRERAGLPLDGFTFGAYVPTAVTSANRSDIDEARQAIRGAALVHARFSASAGRSAAELPAQERDAFATIRDQWNDDLADPGKGSEIWGHAGDKDRFPSQTANDAFIDTFAVVGPPEHCAERLQRMIDAGLSRLLILTRGLGVDPTDENQRKIADQVLPLLRR